MKSKTDSKPEKHDHSHHATGKRPHPLEHFFGCCLGDEPAPLSKKIQSLRENLQLDQLEAVEIAPGSPFSISKDMIIGDILANFPQTRAFFEDLHPLGLMSPALHAITLEIFLSDLAVNPDNICQELSSIINQPYSPNV